MATRAVSAVRSKPKTAKEPTAAKTTKRATAAKTTTASKPKLKAETNGQDTELATDAAPVKSRRKPKGEVRTRIYWGVYNQMAKRVALFEFDQRLEAEKRAAKLLKSSGEHHYIQKLKAVFTQ